MVIDYSSWVKYWEGEIQTRLNEGVRQRVDDTWSTLGCVNRSGGL